MPIRVIYELRVQRQAQAELHESWRAIVAAHAATGALGSMLLRAPDAPDTREDASHVRLIAISRWESVAAWQQHRRDDAAPIAYARFRQLAEVLSRTVCEEIDLIEPA